MLKTRLPVNQTHVKDPRQAWILDSTPWNPDSTIKHFLDSAIRIALHGATFKDASFGCTDNYQERVPESLLWKNLRTPPLPSPRKVPLSSFRMQNFKGHSTEK